MGVGCSSVDLCVLLEEEGAGDQEENGVWSLIGGIMAIATWNGVGGFVVYKRARGNSARLENEDKLTLSRVLVNSSTLTVTVLVSFLGILNNRCASN